MAKSKIIVVGGGLAGLMATIKAAEAGTAVELFSLVPVKRSHSVCAQGGINGAVNTKGEIRAMAGKAGIEVAHKSDSQDICFVPDGDYEKVLNKVGLHHSHAGNFELTDGRKVGKHRGTACYTIGQRKGLRIAWEHPLYVVGKNPATNAVILGKNEELFEKELFAEQLNFINPVVNKFVCTAKIRYKAKDMPCEVEMQDGGAKVQFAEPQRAITPGQGIVFYDGEKILGGGIIK